MKRKIISIIISLAAVVTPALFLTGSSGGAAYYSDIPTITGELSREVSYIYDGVTRIDFDLAESSKYKRQKFSIVQFDPSQDDLYWNVMTGGSYANSHVTTTKTMEKFHAENPDKTVLCATNGGMWTSVGYQSRKVGSTTFHTEYTDWNVTADMRIPRGFAMYNGEIVCSHEMVQETPSAYFYTYGVSTDGRAMFGFLATDVKIYNIADNTTVHADGVNRIPANNALVMYTDKGYSKTNCVDDAWEITVDCGYDYIVKNGETITGTVSKISRPGETRGSMKQNRIMLVARGTAVTEEIKNYTVGDTVSFTVSVRDEIGDTERWNTCENAVGVHMPVIINGVVQPMPEQTTYYPTSMLGIMPNGNVLMYTNYGRQGSGYSRGFRPCDLGDLFVEMGVESAFLLDGGGSATMVCENYAGAYEITGLVCDEGHTERAVANCIILSVGPPKSGVDDTDITFSSETAPVLVREPSNVGSCVRDGVLSLYATGYKKPNVKLDLFGSSADTFGYAAITARPTSGDPFTLGVSPSAGHDVVPSLADRLKVTFDESGTYQTKVLDLTENASWSGRMNYLRLDLFDDTGVGVSGRGIDLKGVKFFGTREEAQAYADAQNVMPGDANGDKAVNLQDAVTVLKYVARWNVTVSGGADANGDGRVNVSDAVRILRMITE